MIRLAPQIGRKQSAKEMVRLVQLAPDIERGELGSEEETDYAITE